MAEIYFNGLIIHGKFIPQEVLVDILVLVEGPELLKCRLVCERWKQLIDTVVWKRKEPLLATAARVCHVQLNWDIYFLTNWKKPFGKNLIRNPSGQEGFLSWEIIQNGGNEWDIEHEPIGADPLPESFGSVTSCFVTSYDLCSKVQFIDLRRCGISTEILDFIKPEFHISEWYCGRFDCCSIFKLVVSFLNEEMAEIGETFLFSTATEQGHVWQEIKTVLKDYPTGARFIRYQHEGHDTQFWAGHYGSKMSGASVICILPSN